MYYCSNGVEQPSGKLGADPKDSEAEVRASQDLSGKNVVSAVVSQIVSQTATSPPDEYAVMLTHKRFLAYRKSRCAGWLAGAALGEGEGIMIQATTSNAATATHNQAGCPYLNQTGCEAVKDWASVLARIDLPALPPDLQLELRRLQQGWSCVDSSTAAR
jgi:hypothetical protein